MLCDAVTRPPTVSCLVSNGYPRRQPRFSLQAPSLLMRYCGFILITRGSCPLISVSFHPQDFAASWNRGYLSSKDEKALKEWSVMNSASLGRLNRSSC
jgi:hypothetical protein